MPVKENGLTTAAGFIKTTGNVANLFVWRAPQVHDADAVLPGAADLVQAGVGHAPHVHRRPQVQRVQVGLRGRVGLARAERGAGRRGQHAEQ